MPVINIQPGVYVRRRGRFLVQVRRNWYDRWASVRRLHALKWFTALPPDMSTAWFKWDAGAELDASDGLAGAGGYQTHRFFPDDINTAHRFLARMDLAFVRIMEVVPPTAANRGGLLRRWIGVIVAEGRDRGRWGYEGGTSPVAPPEGGDQTITAYGLEHLLNLQQIRTAYATARPPAGQFWTLPTDDVVQELSWCPDFNQTLRGGHIAGNRTQARLQGNRYPSPAGVDLHAFCEDGADGAAPPFPELQRWTFAEIAAYLLRFHQPAAHVLDDGNVVSDGGRPLTVHDHEIQFSCDDFAALYGRSAVVQLRGRTLWGMFTESLAAAELGLGWLVQANEQNIGGFVQVWFFSRLERRIAFGNTIIPANPGVIDLNLGGELDVIESVESIAHANQVDVLRVEGERVVVCCNLAWWDGALTADWSLPIEEEYQFAAKNSPLYPGDDDRGAQRRMNDEFRREERFRDVFTRFIVPRTWNGLVGTGLDPDDVGAQPPVDRIVAPFVFPESGAVDPTQAQQLWRHLRQILPRVPLRIDYDYSQAQPVASGPLAARGQLMPLQAWVVDRSQPLNLEQQTQDQKQPFQFVAVTSPAWTYTDGEIGGAQIRPLDDGFGVSIRYPFAHVLARNDWRGDTGSTARSGPTDFDPRETGFDWRELIVLAAFETDQRLSIERLVLPPHLPQNQPAPTAGRPRGLLREMTIRVPDAQLVYVVPGTVYGVDAGGMLKRTYRPDTMPSQVAYDLAGILRNDHQVLEDVAAIALAQYQRERNTVVITLAGTATPVLPGQLIGRLDAGTVRQRSVYSIVERVIVDNESDRGSVSIQTGEATLDPVLVARTG